MISALSSMGFSSSSAGAAPSGTYSGSKSILGQNIAGTLKVDSASALDLKISGPLDITCANEAYTFASPNIDITNVGKAGDCVHDAIEKAPEKVTIESITYDSSADTITVEAKVSILKASVVLSKSSGVEAAEAEAQNVQYPTVAEHAEWFEAFKATYGKTYTGDEHAYRFGVFRENLAAATERNLDGEAVHGVTKFSDLSLEEFRASYLGYKPKANTFDAETEPELPRMTANASTTIDWRTKSPKVLTAVKDQGQCGSCWAFSATEQIETDAAMATGKLRTLSPQQITSCDKVDAGCNGGNTETAYAYVKKAGGLEPSTDYPYKSGNSGKTGRCEAKKAEEVVSISGYTSVSKNKGGEAKMVAQMQKSPISVCVDAEKWQTYTRGVLGRSCGKQLDHCVQAVGLGKQAATAEWPGGKTYWIVRNSWNTDWGVDGYIYVQEGINACGIANDATIVTGAKVTSPSGGFTASVVEEEQ